MERVLLKIVKKDVVEIQAAITTCHGFMDVLVEGFVNLRKELNAFDPQKAKRFLTVAVAVENV
jgi:hypothetical protein